VLHPIDPVDPRIEIRRGWRALVGEVDANGILEKSPHHPEKRERDRQNRQEAVHAIQDTTMPGD
jgi:hypothetical protein